MARFVEAAIKAHTEPWCSGSENNSIPGFFNHPFHLNFVVKFTSWSEGTLTVRRAILRNITLGNRAIVFRYDQTFMTYSEPTTVTAGNPMEDIRIERGGLIYLQGGYNIGQEMEEEFSREANAAGMSEEETWNAFNSN